MSCSGGMIFFPSFPRTSKNLLGCSAKKFGRHAASLLNPSLLCPLAVLFAAPQLIERFEEAAHFQLSNGKWQYIEITVTAIEFLVDAPDCKNSNSFQFWLHRMWRINSVKRYLPGALTSNVLCVSLKKVVVFFALHVNADHYQKHLGG